MKSWGFGTALISAVLLVFSVGCKRGLHRSYEGGPLTLALTTGEESGNGIDRGAPKASLYTASRVIDCGQGGLLLAEIADVTGADGYSVALRRWTRAFDAAGGDPTGPLAVFEDREPGLRDEVRAILNKTPALVSESLTGGEQPLAETLPGLERRRRAAYMEFVTRKDTRHYSRLEVFDKALSPAEKGLDLLRLALVVWAQGKPIDDRLRRLFELLPDQRT